ncbi:MAG: gamma-glutamyl-phosphate reductase, partial [Leptospiraceae bacterium]|nr:gamma-glutamyl-phosphate reductase [Leptospiraceae bacterium]
DKGVCNLFVDSSAIPERTIEVVINSKVQRPGVCNALENLIIHKDYPRTKELLSALQAKGVELYVDEPLRNLLPGLKEADEEAYKTEYLDLKLSVKTVSSLMEAIDFIETYSSGHTEAILSESYENIEEFTSSIDSAAVFVNCSTRFHDGGEFGLGAEVGISTGKLHVRGPMGLMHLTTTKTVLKGRGQVR